MGEWQRPRRRLLREPYCALEVWVNGRMLVFFDGQYVVPGRAGFPYVFTRGCLELDRPRG